MNTVLLNTGQLVTVITGKLSCPMSEVYDAYNSILEENLFTHSLIRADDFVRPKVAKLYPWVESLNYPEKGPLQNNKEYGITIKEWISSVSRKHGELHPVPVMSSEWKRIDPLEELAEITNRKKDS